MRKLLLIVPLLALGATPAPAQEKIRVIAFGAHPDDCDIKASGLAAKYAEAGHLVKFVSITNGNAGHHEMGGGMLAKRRRAEAHESARRLGIAEYEVMDVDDGQLMPTLVVREEVIRRIREWNADIVIAPRPNDYHPDHRYTGILVQDASYMVTVPNLVSDAKPLEKNPLFLSYADRFTRPQPFRPDIVVSIDDVIEKKYRALDAHESQFYEWLAWHAGQLDEVPEDPQERLEWLKTVRTFELPPEWEESARKWYGDEADQIENAEAYEITEYGLQPTEEQIRRLLPFFPE